MYHRSEDYLETRKGQLTVGENDSHHIGYPASSEILMDNRKPADRST